MDLAGAITRSTTRHQPIPLGQQGEQRVRAMRSDGGPLDASAGSKCGQLRALASQSQGTHLEPCVTARPASSASSPSSLVARRLGRWSRNQEPPWCHASSSSSPAGARVPWHGRERRRQWRWHRSATCSTTGSSSSMGCSSVFSNASAVLGPPRRAIDVPRLCEEPRPCLASLLNLSMDPATQGKPGPVPAIRAKRP